MGRAPKVPPHGPFPVRAAGEVEHRMKILIVDDEDDLRHFFAGEIQSAGYQVAQAANGVDAVLQVLEQGADAMIMDIRMPKLDGIDALRILKRLAPALPIIMLTGQAGRGDMLLTTQLGAQTCLLKPIQVDRLLETLDLALQQTTQTNQTG